MTLDPVLEFEIFEVMQKVKKEGFEALGTKERLTTMTACELLNSMTTDEVIAWKERIAKLNGPRH